mgnify:FL=1
MREKTLNLLGLMRKANAIAVGETNTGGAVRAGKAKLLLLASDASDNARSRARGFTHGRDVVTVTLPFTKDEIAAHVGVSGCAMAAITDIWFANAFMKSLAAAVPEGYDESTAEIQRRFERADRRKKEAAAHEKNKRIGKRRNNV